MNLDYLHKMTFYREKNKWKLKKKSKNHNNKKEEESRPEESIPEESRPEESRPEESPPEESPPEESPPEESPPEESPPEESPPEELSACSLNSPVQGPERLSEINALSVSLPEAPRQRFSLLNVPTTSNENTNESISTNAQENTTVEVEVVQVTRNENEDVNMLEFMRGAADSMHSSHANIYMPECLIPETVFIASLPSADIENCIQMCLDYMKILADEMNKRRGTQYEVFEMHESPAPQTAASTSQQSQKRAILIRKRDLR